MINWQKILKDLQHQYKSLAKIGLELDICPSTLQKVARLGCEDMFYRHGVKILELHKTHCKPLRKEIVMANKHSDEFRNAELELVRAALTKPKTRYEVENETGIKSLWMKCERWVKEGKIYKENQMVGKHLMLFYSATPFDEVPVSIEVVENVKSNSRIFRLTDTVHIRARQSRSRTWAGSLNWNAMI